MMRANWEDGEDIRYAAVDSADQDGVKHLKRGRLIVKEPKKSRIAQIDAIKQRLKVDETGKPSIFFFRDRMLHPPDEDLRQEYRPLDVTDEFLSCVYDENVTYTDKDGRIHQGRSSRHRRHCLFTTESGTVRNNRIRTECYMQQMD